MLFVGKSSSVGRAGAAQDLRGLLTIRPCYVLGLVSLGGDRASLAARPDGLRLGHGRSPRSEFQGLRVICKEAEQDQRPPEVLLAEKDEGTLLLTFAPVSPGPPGDPGSAAAFPGAATRGQQRNGSAPEPMTVGRGPSVPLSCQRVPCCSQGLSRTASLNS